jgi:hypothetical protein
MTYRLLKVAPLVLAALIVGCASPRTVLVNEKGEAMTCAGSGAGIIAPLVAHGRHDECVADAMAKGFRPER